MSIFAALLSIHRECKLDLRTTKLTKKKKITTASCAPFAVIPFHTIGKIKIYIYKLEKKTQETKSKPLFVQHKCGGCKQWKRQREREFSSRPAYKKSSFH